MNFFRREGNDIVCTVPITVTEAALGTKIEVPSIDGKTLLANSLRALKAGRNSV